MLKELLKVANKLDALGLSKEADTVDALIRKMAGIGDRKDPDFEPGGVAEGWSNYSQAEHDVWQRETHNVGLAAWDECEKLGGSEEDCRRAYTLAIYRNQFGRDPEM